MDHFICDILIGQSHFYLIFFIVNQHLFIKWVIYDFFYRANIKREYVLTGDIGEKDLKIYGKIAGEYLEFIQAIKDKAFDDLWTVF